MTTYIKTRIGDIDSKAGAKVTMNPGNIYAGPVDKVYPVGYKGARGNFAMFQSWETGIAAWISYMRRIATNTHKAYPKNATLQQVMDKYAPPKENNTNAYLAFISKKIGQPISIKMSDLLITQDDYRKLAQAMFQYEIGLKTPIPPPVWLQAWLLSDSWYSNTGAPLLVASYNIPDSPQLAEKIVVPPDQKIVTKDALDNYSPTSDADSMSAYTAGIIAALLA